MQAGLNWPIQHIFLGELTAQDWHDNNIRPVLKIQNVSDLLQGLGREIEFNPALKGEWI